MVLYKEKAQSAHNYHIIIIIIIIIWKEAGKIAMVAEPEAK
jgi:hypothetical protein